MHDLSVPHPHQPPPLETRFSIGGPTYAEIVESERQRREAVAAMYARLIQEQNCRMASAQVQELTGEAIEPNPEPQPYEDPEPEGFDTLDAEERAETEAPDLNFLTDDAGRVSVAWHLYGGRALAFSHNHRHELILVPDKYDHDFPDPYYYYRDGVFMHACFYHLRDGIEMIEEEIQHHFDFEKIWWMRTLCRIMTLAQREYVLCHAYYGDRLTLIRQLLDETMDLSGNND